MAIEVFIPTIWEWERIGWMPATTWRWGQRLR